MANPGAEYENSNGADKTIDRNQLQAVRLRMIMINVKLALPTDSLVLGKFKQTERNASGKWLRIYIYEAQ